MIAILATLGKLFLETYSKRKAAEHNQYIAELKAGKHNPNALRGLKWATFIQFSAPIWLGFYDVALLDKLLESLDSMPQWYIEAYLMIVGGVWASAVGVDVVTAVIKAYRKSQ